MYDQTALNKQTMEKKERLLNTHIYSYHSQAVFFFSPHCFQLKTKILCDLVDECIFQMKTRPRSVSVKRKKNNNVFITVLSHISNATNHFVYELLSKWKKENLHSRAAEDQLLS